MTVTPRLRMLCRLGQILCAVTALCIMGLMGWLAFDRPELATFLTKLDPGLPRDPQPAYLYTAYVVSLVPTVFTVTALYLAMLLFGRVLTGAFLSAGTGTQLRAIGWLTLGASLLGIIARTAIILILSLQNPLGKRFLSLGLSSNDLLVVLLALIFFIFAQVQAEMARLDEENRSII